MSGILSKGIKLSYSTTSSGTYTEVADVISTPSLIPNVDQVEVTTLSDDTRRYISGLRSYDSLECQLLFNNEDATSNFRVLKGLEGSVAYWKIEYPDAASVSGTGTTFTFSGEPVVGVSGGAVGERLEATLKIILNSAISVTNPA